MIGYEGLNLDDFIGEEGVPSLIIDNALDLLARVEDLLLELDWPKEVHINSGYRNPEHNRRVGGKPKSYHTQGKAVDLADPNQELYKAIAARPELLTKHGLWMEDGEATKTWVHLDIGTRRERPIRIFKP